MKERITIWEFDPMIVDAIRHAPERLIREDVCPPELARQGPLLAPPANVQQECPAIGSWLGSQGADPEIVVAGICQGSGKLEEKKWWTECGPNLETVCTLDAAFRVARLYKKCQLQIWIVDQEYANIISDQTTYTSSPSMELAVGELLAKWCRSRYPNAEILRTSDPLVRSRLYSLLTDGSLAALYPQGVQHPFGNHGRLFWQEMQYLVSVCVFAFSVLTLGKRVCAIADHEQLRVLSASRHIAGNALTATAIWPCPRLGWKPPLFRSEENATQYAERFLGAAKRDRRRMYRGSGPMEIIYAGLSFDQVRERVSANEMSPATVREILWYLGMNNTSDSQVSKKSG